MIVLWWVFFCQIIAPNLGCFSTPLSLPGRLHDYTYQRWEVRCSTTLALVAARPASLKRDNDFVFCFLYHFLKLLVKFWFRELKLTWITQFQLLMSHCSKLLIQSTSKFIVYHWVNILLISTRSPL